MNFIFSGGALPTNVIFFSNLKDLVNFFLNYLVQAHHPQLLK